MAAPPAGVDAGALRATQLVSDLSIRRSFVMRTLASPDLSALGDEVAARLGLPDLSEEECRALLADLRWPGGVECPRCSEASRLLWLTSRSKWHCYGCRYQFSVTAGTLFHGSHLPVWKWFVAVHLMLISPNGVSANELRRTLGGSYKTAWFAAHRIRAAMRGRRTGAEPNRADLRLVSAKYLPAYLDERRWRSANRGNPHVFQDTLRALVDGEGISYERLVAAA
jgi:transposase-like protein